MRSGELDFETGVISATTAPELRTQALFQDHFVAVLRPGHPLCDGPLTASRYAEARHVLVSRRGQPHSPVDEALAKLGLTRPVATLVPGFATALALVRGSDLVATVPEHHCAALLGDLVARPLPFTLPGSGSPCSGIPGWTRIRPTAGCAPSSATSAPSAPTTPAVGPSSCQTANEGIFHVFWRYGHCFTWAARPPLLLWSRSAFRHQLHYWYTHFCIALNYQELPLRGYINRHLICINRLPLPTG